MKFVDAQEIHSSSISANFDRIKQAMEFSQIVQVLSEITDIEKLTENSDDNDHGINDMEKDDTAGKYEIIRRIGAPWNWIYQFVDHSSPSLRSYNFYECQHLCYNKEYDEYFDGVELDISGVGPIISTEITDAFLNYAKSKAQENDGVISLKQIKEYKNCPPMY